MLQNEAGTKERRGLSKMSKPIQPKPPNFVHVLKNRLSYSISQLPKAITPLITRFLSFHTLPVYNKRQSNKVCYPKFSSISVAGYLNNLRSVEKAVI